MHSASLSSEACAPTIRPITVTELSTSSSPLDIRVYFDASYGPMSLVSCSYSVSPSKSLMLSLGVAGESTTTPRKAKPFGNCVSALWKAGRAMPPRPPPRHQA